MVEKTQNDFYQQYVGSTNTATYITDQTLTPLIELVKIDTTTIAIEIELPDTSGATIVDTKRIYISDQGNAATNNITIIPNALDGTTIESKSSFTLYNDNQQVIFELIDNQWLVVANSHPTIPYGEFRMEGNLLVTPLAVGVLADIVGTATASANNEGFIFTTGPNALESTIVNTYKGSIFLKGTMIRSSGSAARIVAIALMEDTGAGFVQIAQCDMTMNGSLKNAPLKKGTDIAFGNKYKAMVINKQTGDDMVVVGLDLVIERVAHE